MPQSAKFEGKGLMVWCGSMVQGDDGLETRQKYLGFDLGNHLAKWNEKSG